MLKHTPQLLHKLENILYENDYKLRNEKGNFKSGFCLLEDQRMIVLNKFTTTESRINTLAEIFKELAAKGLLNEKSVLELKKHSVL